MANRPSGRPSAAAASPARARMPALPLPPPPSSARPAVPSRPVQFRVVVSCMASTRDSARQRSAVASKCGSGTCSMDTPALDSSRHAAFFAAFVGKTAGSSSPMFSSQARPMSTMRRRTRPSVWPERPHSRSAQSMSTPSCAPASVPTGRRSAWRSAPRGAAPSPPPTGTGGPGRCASPSARTARGPVRAGSGRRNGGPAALRADPAAQLAAGGPRPSQRMVRLHHRLPQPPVAGAVHRVGEPVKRGESRWRRPHLHGLRYRPSGSPIQVKRTFARSGAPGPGFAITGPSSAPGLRALSGNGRRCTSEWRPGCKIHEKLYICRGPLQVENLIVAECSCPVAHCRFHVPHELLEDGRPQIFWSCLRKIFGKVAINQVGSYLLQAFGDAASQKSHLIAPHPSSWAQLVQAENDGADDTCASTDHQPFSDAAHDGLVCCLCEN